jgi:hypothetical protein
VTRYVQCPKTHKLVEKAKYLTESRSASVHVMGAFVSPIDGAVIRDGAALREHNRKHGVTDTRDYGPEWFNRKRDVLESKRQGTDPESKQNRIEALKHATCHIRT